MTRLSQQFFSSPSSTLHHPSKTAGTSHSSRYVFLDYWDHSQFDTAENNKQLQDKIKENYDKKIQALAEQVKDLEQQGKSPDEIKSALKATKTKLLQDSFDQALKDLGINKRENGKPVPVTYLDVVNDQEAGPKIGAIFEKYSLQIDGDLDESVDEYFNQKAVVSGKASSALKAVPAATASQDLDSPNPEIQRLQEMQHSRNQVLDSSRKQRSELFNKESMRYRVTTAEIDKQTSPDGGKIKDYDDGYNPFDGVQDENAPTRLRLNGYLYANYIFGGGGEAGNLAVQEGIKKPYELYHVTVGLSRLTMEDLNKKDGLGLEPYVNDVKQYSNFERPIGLMAGMLQLIDQKVIDPAQHQKYREYVIGKFTELKTTSLDEEKQLEQLFAIKSFPEFLQIDPNWKKAYNQIDQLTDSEKSDAKIADYPGTDKTSPTRLQLNGYLYSVYLYSGKNEAVMKSEYDKAAKTYDDSRSLEHPTKMLTQELFQNSFGLEPYLKSLESVKSEVVKGVMAGLLKQSEKENSNYQKYIRTFVDQISKVEGEDNQLMQLATVLPPLEAQNTLSESSRDHTLKTMIEATRQHNQFKFSDTLSKNFELNSPTLSPDQYAVLSLIAVKQVQDFINTRAEADQKVLREKYQILVDNNSKLKKPLYSLADLDPLRKSIEDTNKQFDEARGANRSADLTDAINNKYLEKLSSAEKSYFERAAELDANLKAVADLASGKTSVDMPAGGGSSDSGSDNPSDSNDDSDNGIDPYTASWKKAERVTPLLGDYAGPLIADSTNPSEKVIGYSYKGEKVATLNNQTEVTRTPKDALQPARLVEGLNFIRVTYQGKKLWIPEEELFQKEDQPDSDSSDRVQKSRDEALRNQRLEGYDTLESDTFTSAWASGNRIDSLFQTQEGKFLGKSPDGSLISVRNNIGEVIGKLPDNSEFLRTAGDAAQKARQVNGLNFIQLTFNNIKVWVDEKIVSYQPLGTI